MKQFIFLCILTTFILGTFSGCSLLRSSPADLSGFLPKSELLEEHRERAPFHGYWVYDAQEYEKLRDEYRKIYIAPIDLSPVIEQYKKRFGNPDRREDRISEAQELANYFREKLKIEFRNDPNRYFLVVDDPGPEVLSLRLALTHIVPTSPGVNIIGTVAGFLIPGGGLVRYAGEGSIAMEGYVAEEPSPLFPLEEFSDREGQKASPFTIKDYQLYAHIRLAIDEWAMQLKELLTTPHEHKVEGSNLVSINPL